MAQALRPQDARETVALGASEVLRDEATRHVGLARAIEGLARGADAAARGCILLEVRGLDEAGCLGVFGLVMQGILGRMMGDLRREAGDATLEVAGAPVPSFRKRASKWDRSIGPDNKWWSACSNVPGRSCRARSTARQRGWVSMYL
mgnify:CR=1 FL=1